MKRAVRRPLLLVASLGFYGAVSPACVDYPQAILVSKVVTPTLDQETGVCKISAAGDALISGAIDIAAAGAYLANVVVQNQMFTREDRSKQRVETSKVFLLGATVRATLLDGTPLEGRDGKGQVVRTGNEYTSRGTGFVEANIGAAPGLGTVEVILLDPDTINTLRIREDLKVPGSSISVLTYTRVQGQSAGGLAVESQEFQFPITVFNKSLVDFHPDPANPANVCAILPTSSTDKRIPACRPGQDQRTDCLDCQSQEYCRTKK